MSLPSRGAWIEIKKMVDMFQEIRGRSPHGERGLKLHMDLSPEELDTVAPLTGSVD